MSYKLFYGYVIYLVQCSLVPQIPVMVKPELNGFKAAIPLAVFYSVALLQASF